MIYLDIIPYNLSSLFTSLRAKNRPEGLPFNHFKMEKGSLFKLKFINEEKTPGQVYQSGQPLQ